MFDAVDKRRAEVVGFTGHFDVGEPVEQFPENGGELPCGDGFLVVASKGGTPHHPQWYKNLQADQNCEVVAGSFRCRAVAVTVEDDEREPRWEQMVRFWPDYEIYQARTERQIPIVKLVVESVSLEARSRPLDHAEH